VSSKATIDDDFVSLLLRTFNDLAEHGVHLLFNEWERMLGQPFAQVRERYGLAERVAGSVRQPPLPTGPQRLRCSAHRESSVVSEQRRALRAVTSTTGS
jgi:hypothetical protein